MPIPKKSLFAVALLLAALAPAAHAKSLRVDDFDTLLWLSDAIVEAEITGQPAADDPDGPTEFRIIKTFAGGLMEKETIAVANMFLYAKHLPGDGDFKTKHLEIGDRLFLFLKNAPPATPPAASAPAEKFQHFSLLDAGARLITTQGVVAFYPEDESAPYVANAERKNSLTPENDFRASLDAGVRAAADVRTSLAAAGNDGPKLLALLKSRADSAPTKPWRPNYVDEAIANHLANLYDPALSDQALALSGHQLYGHLSFSFATTRGRTYLLAKLTDAKLPVDLRILYTHIIIPAGSQFTADAPTAARATTQPATGPANNHYIEKLAQLAIDHAAAEPAFCKAIIIALGSWSIMSSDPEVAIDLRTAVALLKKLAAETPDDSIRTTIAAATVNMIPPGK